MIIERNSGGQMLKQFLARRTILEVVAVLLIIAGVLGYVFYYPKLIGPKAILAAGTLSTCNDSDAVSLIKPNVVKIENKTASGTTIGTGFYDTSGYLVTNSHVVDQKGDITIYSPDGKQISALLVGNSISKDIAILRTADTTVKALVWANNLDLKEPDSLMAIGFALNLPGEATVTKGSFSAKRSSQEVMYIQTDTALNGGNSGGPLINSCGQVVGINTLSVPNASINLAISSDSAPGIISSLIQDKKVEYLSGARQSILSDMLKSVGLEVDEATAIAEGQAAETTTDGQTTVTTSKTATSSSKKSTKPDSGYGVCDSNIKLSATKTTVEIGEKSMLYLPVYTNITWNGGGTFSDITSTGASFSSGTAGTFDIFGTYTKKDGSTKSCTSNSVSIIVNSAPTRIEGIARIGAMNAMEPTFSKRLNTNAIRIGIYYLDRYGTDLSAQSPRNYRVPISADIKIYKTAPTNQQDRQKLIYSKNFSNSELNGMFESDLQGSYSIYREMLVPRGAFDVNDSDYDIPDNNGNLTRMDCSFDLTVHTPEQGSFTTTGHGSLIKY